MRNRRMNKKGLELKFVYLVLWVVLLVSVFGILISYTSLFVKQTLDVRDSEARVVMNRLLYSRFGLAHFDAELGRIYPNTVELQKLNSQFLDNALILEGNQMMSMEVVLTSKSLNFPHKAIFNEDWYYRWLPLAGKKGSGASTWIIEERLVSIYNNGEYNGTGVLQLNILMPNA